MRRIGSVVSSGVVMCREASDNFYAVLCCYAHVCMRCVCTSGVRCGGKRVSRDMRCDMRLGGGDRWCLTAGMGKRQASELFRGKVRGFQREGAIVYVRGKEVSRRIEMVRECKRRWSSHIRSGVGGVYE